MKVTVGKSYNSPNYIVCNVYYFKESVGIIYYLYHQFEHNTKNLPQFEVRVYHSVGETFTANTDTFKYTVTGQLVHYQVGVNDTRLFQFVGDDTTYEMRLSRSQSSHQVVQLFLWDVKVVKNNLAMILEYILLDD